MRASLNKIVHSISVYCSIHFWAAARAWNQTVRQTNHLPNGNQTLKQIKDYYIDFVIELEVGSAIGN